LVSPYSIRSHVPLLVGPEGVTKLLENLLDDPIRIPQDVDVRESQYAESLRVQEFIPTSVTPEPFVRVMVSTVDLDNQLRLPADEIDYILSNRSLPSEVDPGLVPAKTCPEFPFGIGHLLA